MCFSTFKSSAICVDQCCARVSPGTDPGTGKISQSVLEPDPEPPKALGQFRNVFFGMSAPTLRNKGIIFGCVLGKH